MQAKTIFRYVTLVGIVLGVLICGSFLGLLWPDVRWINLPLHATMESLGALAGISIAMLLLQRRAEAGRAIAFTPALGLLGMGGA